MNDTFILLQAKLDKAKSKTSIQADLTKLQAKLDKLKLQPHMDPKAVSALTRQLEEILDQKILLPEISFDQKAAKQSVNVRAFPWMEKIQNSLHELKDVNRILTEISKTAQHISKTDLSNGGVAKSSDQMIERYPCSSSTNKKSSVFPFQENQLDFGVL